MGSESKLGRRRVAVNARFIRGFICPDYRAITAALSASSWAREAAYWAANEGSFLGDGSGNMLWDKSITRE